MKILVTGGAGFIGSHICDMFLELKHEVHVIDSHENKCDFTPERIARNHVAVLESMVIKDKYDFVVHAAARADISQNWSGGIDEREHLWQCNVTGTLSLLEQVAAPIVFLSTAAVYDNGESLGNIQNEESPCTATSPYAASKLFGEHAVQSYAYGRGLPWWVLRLSSVVGARYHHGHIADFVAQAKKNDAVKPLNDGMAKRSYVHVRDVCEAIRMCANKDLPQGVYNVTTGTWSPRDTQWVMGAKARFEWPGLNPCLACMKRKGHDAYTACKHGWIGDAIVYAANNKLRNAGWTPIFSIENGVRDALSGLGWTP